MCSTHVSAVVISFVTFLNDLEINRKPVFGHLNTLLTFLELQLFSFLRRFFSINKVLVGKETASPSIMIFPKQALYPTTIIFSALSFKIRNWERRPTAVVQGAQRSPWTGL
jgi:hypothetical protein